MTFLCMYCFFTKKLFSDYRKSLHWLLEPPAQSSNPAIPFPTYSRLLIWYPMPQTLTPGPTSVGIVSGEILIPNPWKLVWLSFVPTTQHLSKIGNSEASRISSLRMPLVFCWSLLGDFLEFFPPWDDPLLSSPMKVLRISSLSCTFLYFKIQLNFVQASWIWPVMNWWIYTGEDYIYDLLACSETMILHV
jgi:hypothetical protein